MYANDPPSVLLLEKSRCKKAIVKTALLLTLSRTVWIGLIFHECLFLFFMTRSLVKKMTFAFGLLTTVVFSSLFIYHFFGFDLTFLFDRSMGGRWPLIESALRDSPYISWYPFTGIGEVIYANIAISFGTIGLIFFLIAMMTPLVFSLFIPFSYEKRSLIIGLTNYLFVSVSDGAILYIPVMAFYWFLSSLLWKDLSSSPQALSPSDPHHVLQ
jgi:hypothetical protein